MAIHGRYRGDITSHGISGPEQFGLRWNDILFPGGMPAVQLAPATPGDASLAPAPAPFGHGELTLPMPIDADSALILDFSAIGQNADHPPIEPEAAGPAAAAAPDPVSPPPYFAAEPLHDPAADPASAPVDAAPPGGFIPKSEALIWSGPAIMAFPADSHDATSGTAPPDLSSAPDSAGTSDLPGTPEVAGTPDAVTRADLDPVLTAMGSGPDHAPPSGDAGGDLATAFLPPDDSDLPALPPHGLDPGFAFTPQPPLPPPPDVIG